VGQIVLPNLSNKREYRCLSGAMFCGELTGPVGLSRADSLGMDERRIQNIRKAVVSVESEQKGPGM
jgi:hypothetical protein